MKRQVGRGHKNRQLKWRYSNLYGICSALFSYLDTLFRLRPDRLIKRFVCDNTPVVHRWVEDWNVKPFPKQTLNTIQKLFFTTCGLSLLAKSNVEPSLYRSLSACDHHMTRRTLLVFRRVELTDLRLLGVLSGHDLVTGDPQNDLVFLKAKNAENW